LWSFLKATNKTATKLTMSIANSSGGGYAVYIVADYPVYVNQDVATYAAKHLVILMQLLLPPFYNAFYKTH
jgi:hypothetical protein